MTAQENHHNTFLVQRFVEHAARLSREGKDDEALRVLTQAYSIDPFDPSAQALEKEIMLRVAGPSRFKIPNDKEETTAELSSETASSIAEHIANAYQFRKKQDYAGALHEIAEALALDPLSELLHQLEKDIYEEYKRHQHDGQRKDTTVTQALDDHRREGEPPSTPPPPLPQAHELAPQPPIQTTGRTAGVPPSQGEGRDQRLRQAEDEYYERARDLLSQKAYEEALSEIALGLLLDEHSEKLRLLEAEIWNAQADPGEQTPGEPSESQKAVLKDHLRSAEEHLKTREFDRALDELINVYMIDPLNAEANKLEQRIRQKQMKEPTR